MESICSCLFALLQVINVSRVQIFSVLVFVENTVAVHVELHEVCTRQLDLGPPALRDVLPVLVILVVILVLLGAAYNFFLAPKPLGVKYVPR